MIDYNTSLAKEKVPEAFKYVLPVFVASQVVVVPNMEIKKLEGMKKVINW